VAVVPAGTWGERGAGLGDRLCSTTTGPLTLFPAGTARPGTTAVSLPARLDAALVAMRIGAGGAVSVAGAAGSMLDVVGWYRWRRRVGQAARAPWLGRDAMVARFAAYRTPDVRPKGAR
jgi:hypothetical protein